MAVDELPTAEISTGLATVAPDAGLQIVTEGGPVAGEHAPPPPPLLVTVTIAESLFVVSAALVATIV